MGASVRGNNETGRYVATITNNTDTDLYATCYVNAVVEYGSVGSDRFLVRGVAEATTDHQGSASLDDGGAEYEIECVKEFSVEPNATVGPIDRVAAVRACFTTNRLYGAPRLYDPKAKPAQLGTSFGSLSDPRTLAWSRQRSAPSLTSTLTTAMPWSSCSSGLTTRATDSVSTWGADGPSRATAAPDPPVT